MAFDPTMALLEDLAGIEIAQNIRDKAEFEEGLRCVISRRFGSRCRVDEPRRALLLAKLKAGRVWTGDLKVSFYQDLGVSAVHLDMAYRQPQGKLSSVKELAEGRIEDLAEKAKSKRVDIKRKTESGD